jgi:hypothetical protein
MCGWSLVAVCLVYKGGSMAFTSFTTQHNITLVPKGELQKGADRGIQTLSYTGSENILGKAFPIF